MSMNRMDAEGRYIPMTEQEREESSVKDIALHKEPKPTMNNVMLDLETMGNTKQAAIIAIGAVRFDENGLGDSFYRKVSLQSSVDAGMKMDASTVLWWLGQEDAARLPMAHEYDAINGRESVALPDALSHFASWLHRSEGGPLPEPVVWGNGSDFDNAILSEAYMLCGNEAPWAFWNNRCYRTMKSLFPSVKKPDPDSVEGVKHNALYDAKFQAMHLIDILKHLRGTGLSLYKVKET